ncbi:MAG: YbaY family lipoprotein, partial [Microvirgula sp.]
MSRLGALALAVMVAAGLAACAATPPARSAAAVAPAQVTVTGRALLLAGAAALPPGALLRVQLLDTSLADAPATVLAEQYTVLEGER